MRDTEIESVSHPWEGRILPLNQSRILFTKHFFNPCPKSMIILFFYYSFLYSFCFIIRDQIIYKKLVLSRQMDWIWNDIVCKQNECFFSLITFCWFSVDSFVSGIQLFHWIFGNDFIIYLDFHQNRVMTILWSFPWACFS